MRDLRWRYVEGPSGNGRATMGMANSTGCSSVWGSTWPYNPYPFPWVNHLFQDSPSIAIGLFEAQMRKMADDVATVRRAELLSDGAYDAAAHEPALRSLTWQQFTDDEFALCPPIVAMGGDGAMLDIGFQNLSRLLASGKPIKVVVLDTQVYSNTGGQACTSGYTGQVADMTAYGKAQHGKTETRKELALLAIAHRGAYVHQSSQASASHLVAGVLKGLHKRRPAVFNIYTPCPVEHGLADDWSQTGRAARAREPRLPVPHLRSRRGRVVLRLPEPRRQPVARDVRGRRTRSSTCGDDGSEQTLELPLTIADWAATESRFKQHFADVPRRIVDRRHDAVPRVPAACRPPMREGRAPYILAAGKDGTLRRLRRLQRDGRSSRRSASTSGRSSSSSRASRSLPPCATRSRAPSRRISSSGSRRCAASTRRRSPT